METMKDKRISLDIETSGLNALTDRITTICARDSHTGEWFANVDEDEVQLILNFIKWLRLRDTNEYMLLSKNGKRFDIPFILLRLFKNELDPKGAMFILDYCHFDFQDVTCKWVGMDDMARLLHCKVKSSNGFEAINMWKNGQHDVLVDYCKNDVEVLEELFGKYMLLILLIVVVISLVADNWWAIMRFLDNLSRAG